jgi:hypothetical protein
MSLYVVENKNNITKLMRTGNVWCVFFAKRPLIRQQ